MVKRVSLLVLFCIASAGCERKPTAVGFKDVCKPEHNNRYMEVKAFMTEAVVMSCSGREGALYCRFPVYETPGTSGGDPYLTAYIPQGEGPNSVSKVSSGFDPKAVRIRDKDGKLVSKSIGLNLAGTVYTAGAEPAGCFLEVERITQ